MRKVMKALKDRSRQMGQQLERQGSLQRLANLGHFDYEFMVEDLGLFSFDDEAEQAFRILESSVVL